MAPERSPISIQKRRRDNNLTGRKDIGKPAAFQTAGTPVPMDKYHATPFVFDTNDINQTVDHTLLWAKNHGPQYELKLSHSTVQRVNDPKTARGSQTIKPLPRRGLMATILKFVGTASSRKNAL